MAGKKSRDQYVSKGERRNVAKSGCTKRAKGTLEHALRQRQAWSKGRNVVLTIDNPNKNETNRRKIKINAREVWGDPKKQRSFMMKDA
jgi:hypothetical protein